MSRNSKRNSSKVKINRRTMFGFVRCYVLDRGGKKQNVRKYFLLFFFISKLLALMLTMNVLYNVHGTCNKEVRSIHLNFSQPVVFLHWHFFPHFELHIACVVYPGVCNLNIWCCFIVCVLFVLMKTAKKVNLIFHWKWNHFKHSLHFEFTFIYGFSRYN